MPTFYFHLHDDVDVLDDDGADLPDIKAAELTALKNIRSLAAEQVLKGHLNLSHRIDVADPTGKVVRSIRFGEAIEITS